MTMMVFSMQPVVIGQKGRKILERWVALGCRAPIGWIIGYGYDWIGYG